MIVTAFISYVGCFTRKYRTDLMEVHWLPYLDKMETKIPRTQDVDPLSLLTDDAQIAQWNNEGYIWNNISQMSHLKKLCSSNAFEFWEYIHLLNST